MAQLLSDPMFKEGVEKLKRFIEFCKLESDILHSPELQFFREYIESLGGKIPPLKPKMNKPQSANPAPESKNEESEVKEENSSDVESDLELDMTGCVEPDKLDDNQKMGDANKEVTPENEEKANEKRMEAQAQFSEGNFEKAIELYTEAIELNPNSALLFAKRGQVYLKMNKPNACIRDCTKALELNCDSAAGYKFRGRAYRLLGEWELAAKDLRQACNIDFDEQTGEWLNEVTPNAQKIEQHNLKKERRKLEKKEKEKQENLRKAREAHAKAAQENARGGADGPGMNFGGMPGMSMPGMDQFSSLFNDPSILADLQDPEVAEAFRDISANPSNYFKYASNPKISALLAKFASKFGGGAGGMTPPGFGGFPGFNMPGAGGANPTQQQFKQEDDNLD